MREPIAHPDPKLAAQIEDIVWASDREFFKTHPQRQYRLRPAWDIELKDQEVMTGDVSPPLCDGHCWWTIVYQVTPGVRARQCFQAPHDLPIDPPEAACRIMAKRLRKTNPRFAEITAALRELDKKLRPVKGTG